MLRLPIRCRALGADSHLFVHDNGSYFTAPPPFTSRLLADELTPSEQTWLQQIGFFLDDENAAALDTHAYAVTERLTKASSLDYLILVPTLRCNLSCTYCQVSRVDAKRAGFDWSEDTLASVLSFIDGLESPALKIEFQGGEPTLRPDLIQRVIDRCKRFEHSQFVICTNLQEVGEEVLDIFDRPDVFISTSLDGDLRTHDRQRTKGHGSAFASNLNFLLERYGSGKIHALPTVDPKNPPDQDALIDAFQSRGISSIFLRPINYQGFARKRHSHSLEQDAAWRTYYEKFVRKLIARNWSNQDELLEETYFSICLRRIFKPGRDRHVDLRNPNPAGEDYLLIDYDGALYPTDEARMLTRSGVIDLRLGKVGDDWRGETWQLLNEASTNQFDPACQRCTYQPFCGRDLVDDLSRYGTVDVERTSTAFCRKHMHVFDLIFTMIEDTDPAVQFSLSRWLGMRSVRSLQQRLA